MSAWNENPTFLKKSIESILSQSFTDFEFIIINDGSSKETSDILKKYVQNDNRVILLENASNLGLTRSLNIGIRKSKGEFIARMDSDDISSPERLEKELGFISKNNFDLIMANCDFINNKDEIIKQKILSPITDLKKSLMKGNFFIHSTFFGKKKVFNELYNEKFQRAQDYEFLLRVLGKGYELGQMSDSVLKYRINTESISIKKAKQQEFCALKARLLAITKYGYGYSFLPYLLRSLLILMLPYKLKNFIVYKILK